MMEILKQPWPWYTGGIIIGLTVPLLLILGNKHFGISANLRHACAAFFPGKIKFFRYNWKREIWNVCFACGILVGGFLATKFLSAGNPIEVNPALMAELKNYGISDNSSLVPSELFSVENIFTPRSMILLIGGGFLVGFGTRYAGGCTSGHSIMGISNLQLPSVIATISFMVGGFLMANFLLPFILKL